MTLRFERWGFRIHLEATVMRGGTTTTGRLRGRGGSFAKDWLGVPKNMGKPFQNRWRVLEVVGGGWEGVGGRLEGLELKNGILNRKLELG